MKLFVAASYSSKVDYSSGEVFDDYKTWLEDVLATIEHSGHTVFSALREDGYKINNAAPADAYRLDVQHIQECDAVLALLDNDISGGVQTEIGFALGRGKKVFLAHREEDALSYFNAAMVNAGAVQELLLPFTHDVLRKLA